jgi:hypothetical protein
MDNQVSDAALVERIRRAVARHEARFQGQLVRRQAQGQLRVCFVNAFHLE